MSVYTIKSVQGDPKSWEGNYGPMLTYRLDLAEEDGRVAMGVELNRKPESRAPQPGEQVAGHIEPGKFCDKLKIDFEATKALKQGGSRPSGSSAERTTGGGKSDDVQRQIIRQHSQGVAAQILVAERAAGEIHEVNLPDLFDLCDELDQDVFKAGQAASQASGSAAPNEGASTSSAPSPASDSRPADDEHTDIEMALDSAGLMNSAARLLVTNYMLQELSEERRSKAFSMLRNPAEQAETLKKLETLTEGWHGESLPTDASGAIGDGDDIPFARPEYREPFSERERWRF